MYLLSYARASYPPVQGAGESPTLEPDLALAHALLASGKATLVYRLSALEGTYQVPLDSP